MSKKRSNRDLENDVDFLNRVVENLQYELGKPLTGKAILTSKSLKHIKPITYPQKQMMEYYFAGNSICTVGSAGTGKTLIAIYLALCDVLNSNNNINNIRIVRSAVATRDIGFVPGDIHEKQKIYEQPYYDIFSFLFGKETSYEVLKKSGVVNFCLTSHVRGTTWDDCVVIIDEAQNMIFKELNSVITRLGKNSKIIIIGDNPQCDLNEYREKSGLDHLLKVIEVMDEIVRIDFTPNDIVRSDFVKSWLTAVETIQLN